MRKSAGTKDSSKVLLKFIHTQNMHRTMSVNNLLNNVHASI